MSRHKILGLSPEFLASFPEPEPPPTADPAPVIPQDDVDLYLDFCERMRVSPTARPGKIEVSFRKPVAAVTAYLEPELKARFEAFLDRTGLQEAAVLRDLIADFLL